MRLRPSALALAAAVGAGLSAPAAAPAAEALLGVTTNNVLITVASDSPGAVRSAVPISGLQPNESIIGIDVRPATGQLYGLGSLNRVYVINPASGAAKVTGEPFSPPLAGTSFGFDFNPTADRIRVVSDGRQNLRLNPENGAVAAQDAQLAYADGDPGFGMNPQIGSAAYTNEPQTRLLGIDSARDVLVFQDPPNDGKLKTVGALAVNVAEPVSFDIAADNRGWVSAQQGGAASPWLLTADLAKGTLAPAAAAAALPTVHGSVRAIAAIGTVPDDKTAPALLVDVDRNQPLRALRTKFSVGFSCSEACTATFTLLRGKTVLRSTPGVLQTAGASRVRVNVSRRSKALGKPAAKGKPKVKRNLTLRVTAVDAAGNRTTIRKKLTFQ